MVASEEIAQLFRLVERVQKDQDIWVLSGSLPREFCRLSTDNWLRPSMVMAVGYFWIQAG
jgi:fructose-1-phosphate kinase PfkB-like protein